jgi:hypothetical protein
MKITVIAGLFAEWNMDVDTGHAAKVVNGYWLIIIGV